ncbi:unnamed protein product [Symbiodinium natans]|uniref:Uncharacterized protein n=1 Tax=Symbiodinium natans TaxID=878477 RepID=A0A812LQP0_9DINO|nr:unnamed protein product [Symbiodinium natans]
MNTWNLPLLLSKRFPAFTQEDLQRYTQKAQRFESVAFIGKNLGCLDSQHPYSESAKAVMVGDPETIEQILQVSDDLGLGLRKASPTSSSKRWQTWTRRFGKNRTYHKYFCLLRRRGMLNYFDQCFDHGARAVLHGPDVRSLSFSRPHGRCEDRVLNE